MRREIRADGTEVEIDDDGQCRFIRVPVHLMDGLDGTQRAVARDRAPANSYERYVADHAAQLDRYAEIGRTALGNRYLAPSDQQRRAGDDAYGEMVARLGDAWQRPAEPAVDAEPPQRTGDADAAYAEMVSRVTGAWRQGRAA